jgi:hypothetical protein
MRGPFRESEPLRIVERPPHPRRVLVFRSAVLPSPRNPRIKSGEGEVLITSGTHGLSAPSPRVRGEGRDEGALPRV